MPDVNLIPTEYKKRKKGITLIFSKTGGVVLVLLVIALLLYAGLLFYQNKLNKDLNDIKQEIEALDQKRDPEMEKSMVDLDKKLGTLKGLFEDHVYWSKLFNKIEELTLIQAYFSDVKSDILRKKDIKTVLSGNTLTYTSLAKQMKSFQDDSLVERVEVAAISLSPQGGIDFDLEVIFSKDILSNHD